MSLLKPSYEDLSDEKLLSKMASGNQHAFDLIYKRYANALLNYFYRRMWKDREKAEDFVHDLFTKLIQKPELFDTTRSFKTWIYSVANNMCKNEYKKQEVRSNTTNGLEHYQAVSDQSHDSSIHAHFVIFGEEFQEKLNELDSKHRDAFLMRHVEGFSIKEIAETLQINEGTAKSRIFNATKQLANKLAHYQTEKNKYHG